MNHYAVMNKIVGKERLEMYLVNFACIDTALFSSHYLPIRLCPTRVGYKRIRFPTSLFATLD